MEVGRRPTLDEIEERLAAPVEGRPTRDEADRRAARRMAGDEATALVATRTPCYSS
ncbi:hypothetical protein ACH4ZU_01425 [Streptomyces sp. NPDC020472]|uniref:hypothetical protein n=1 Tax=Streptomyces sp. NPDC020472 TaxID=3365075 RepID=UPI0037B81452